MDLIRIGAFIKEKRKEKGMTQQELAAKLHVTDRAVSKWEVGRGMPDTTIMRELCELLGITLNELLGGQSLTAENKEKQIENNTMELLQERQNNKKRTLLKFLSGFCIYAVFGAIIGAALGLVAPDMGMGTVIVIAVGVMIGAGLGSEVEQAIKGKLSNKKK